MPYLHWELEDARKEMSSVIKELQKSNEETLDNLIIPFGREYFSELFKPMGKGEGDKEKQPGTQATKDTEPDVSLLEEFLFQ